jgi:glyoxylase-like metal-dependent hydrolase (beta-lactamase superfamily II)|tara:strand:- start:421 stop:1473 length:1053 start_codon:yes stop_codon:yes gene_type:complete
VTVSDTRKQEGISYPFETRPEFGESMPVVPGIVWLRSPLPFKLDHINLWLLEDGDGWTVADTGVFFDEAKAAWHKAFDGPMAGRPVDRIVVTHLHPDHIGCAGWLSETFDAPLWMTRGEYLLCRVLVADTGRTTPEAGNRFYRGAGFPLEAMDYYHKMFGMFGKYVSPVPEAYRRLQDGDCFEIGPDQWQVIIGRGHSPEHACLYCAERNLLISGDQLLPTISPNVSVYPTEPEANPLGDWLESLKMLKASIPADVLVLPAHGRPFRGAHERLDVLIAEHNDGLDKLQVLCREPRRAVDVFPVLFKSEINKHNLILATGESVAHLNYLLDEGRIEVESDTDGVNWYRAAG